MKKFLKMYETPCTTCERKHLGCHKHCMIYRINMAGRRVDQDRRLRRQ